MTMQILLLQGTRGLVSIPEAEYQSLERKVKVTQQTENQLEESDRLNTHLQEVIAQLREGKVYNQIILQ